MPTKKPTAKIDPALASLSDEQKVAVMKAISDFPEGCQAGKARFAQKYGLPVPPEKATFAVYISVDVPAADITTTPYGARRLKEAVRKATEETIKKAVTGGGLTIDSEYGSSGVDFEGLG